MDQPIDLSNSDYNEGSVLLLAVGAKITWPIALLPTFAARLNNSLGTGFSGGDNAPAKIERSFDVGLSITPKLTRFMRLHMEVDMRDLNHRHKNVPFSKKIALGAELDFSRRIFVRLGLSNGFGSFGLGMKTKNFSCDLTTYAVELTNRLRGQEDRRFAFSFSIGR